jgi:chemotaxis protein CheX
MKFDTLDLRLLIENVFASTMDMRVMPMLAATAETPWPARRARITISGPWHGTVVVAASEPTLRAVVASMCLVHPHECSESDLDDGIVELANIVGGGVKSLLPDECRLGLPALASEAELPAAGTALVDRQYRCDGEPFRMCIVGSDEE